MGAMPGALDDMQHGAGNLFLQGLPETGVAQAVLLAGDEQGGTGEFAVIRLLGHGAARGPGRLEAHRRRTLPGAMGAGEIVAAGDVVLVFVDRRIHEDSLDDLAHMLARAVVGIEDLPGGVVRHIAPARDGDDAVQRPGGRLARRQRQQHGAAHGIADEMGLVDAHGLHEGGDVADPKAPHVIEGEELLGLAEAHPIRRENMEGRG